MKRGRVLVLVAAIFALACPAHSRSVRATYPQLVGVDCVALFISPDDLPGLDADALEWDIRNKLKDSGFKVRRNAPVTLFVRITFQRIPECPESIVLRTYLALSEDAEIRRGSRIEKVSVDTWHVDENLIATANDAGNAAHQSVLGLLGYFIDSAQYSAKVKEE